MDQRGTHAELGEDLDDADDAERNTDDAPFCLSEEDGEGLDKGELKEHLKADVQGLPLDRLGESAFWGVAHLATLTARVSRITVTFT